MEIVTSVKYVFNRIISNIIGETQKTKRVYNNPRYSVTRKRKKTETKPVLEKTSIETIKKLQNEKDITSEKKTQPLEPIKTQINSPVSHKSKIESPPKPKVSASKPMVKKDDTMDTFDMSNWIKK